MRVLEEAWNHGEESSSSSDEHGVVTVAWQNISAHLKLADLVSFLELLGFEGAYEDVFVVIDGSGASTGVAMVTFSTMAQAIAFQSLVDGKVGKVFGNASEPCRAAIIDGAWQAASRHWLDTSTLEDADAHGAMGRTLLERAQGGSPARQKPWVPEAPAQGAGHAKPNASARNKISAQPPQPPAQVAEDEDASSEEPEIIQLRRRCLGPPPGLLEETPEAELPEWPAGVTTAMIRHIACRFTEPDVIEVLDSLGLQGKYDGVKVARRPMMQSNLGYAFVNFVDAAAAKLCRRLCHGRAFGTSYTVKVCEVVPARVQGAIDAFKPRRRGATKRAPPHPVYSAAMQPYDATAQPYDAALQPYDVAMQPYALAMQQPYDAALQRYDAAAQPAYAAPVQPYAAPMQPAYLAPTQRCAAAYAVPADAGNAGARWISL